MHNNSNKGRLPNGSTDIRTLAEKETTIPSCIVPERCRGHGRSTTVWHATDVKERRLLRARFPQDMQLRSNYHGEAQRSRQLFSHSVRTRTKHTNRCNTDRYMLLAVTSETAGRTESHDGTYRGHRRGNSTAKVPAIPPATSIDNSKRTTQAKHTARVSSFQFA